MKVLFSHGCPLESKMIRRQVLRFGAWTLSVHDCLDPESRAQPVSESLQKESSHSLKLFPVVKMENLHKLLPDPSPFGLPSFDLFPRREIDGGSTLRPVQDQQLFDKGCDLLGIITHEYTRSQSSLASSRLLLFTQVIVSMDAITTCFFRCCDLRGRRFR